MSELRHRKLRDLDGGPKDNNLARKAQPVKQNRLFVYSIIVFTFVTFYLGTRTTTFHPMVETIASKLGYHQPVYAVIIDAGSTGSRVLAYTFHKSFIGDDLVLDGELFKEVKPGLSAYVDNPEMGAQAILGLLNDANTIVPEPFRRETPLLLRATAGLRLLDPVAAENLVNSVRYALMHSGYRVGEDSVDIMDGVDEGIYSWYTVNFLQGKLASEKTSAALDLGGGSTQITYEPHGDGSPKPVITLPGPHRNISLYTYSYLNLGLMAARRGILLAENDKDEKYVTSECVNPIVKDSKWRYSNEDYFVSGSQKNITYKELKETQTFVSERYSIVKFEHCRSLISALLTQRVPPAEIPIDLAVHHINAFSYYFDRASDAGLIDPLKGGVITVKDFIKASERECSTANVDQPWACFDLTFISTFLQEALKLSPDTKLELVKKINGHEISWALGLAYNTLNKML